MTAAIAEAELARGTTGDNPWVGSVIVVGGAIIARGHTQGPGEDHAEIGALREARRQGVDLGAAVLYPTLEPCSFHGRTPACAAVIAAAGVHAMVTGIRDPNPRVDGAGAAIVRAGGVEVIEDVCAAAIRRHLGPWIFWYHPHEPLRRARATGSNDEHAILRLLMDAYAVEESAAIAIARAVLSPT